MGNYGKGNKGQKELNSLLENICAADDLVFYGLDLMDEKMFTLFIKKTEFICRKSQEYDIWQRRTKSFAVNQNSDPDKDDSENCPICGISYEYAAPESHHHPITLFNLCVKQFQIWVDNKELNDKRPLDLVQEVMETHLCGGVEHVVLCKHCHEKYHNGEKVTREELTKIIEYKRSLKTESYPDTVKEVILLKNAREEQFRQRRRKDNQMVLSNLIPEEISREDLIGGIMEHIDAHEFYEEIKEKDQE